MDQLISVRGFFFMGYKILVVDDERNIREFLFVALSRVDEFSVELAENGEEALRKIEKGQFDLVLADLKMPRMDGLQLIAEIINSKPDILTVLMTGYGTIDTALKAIKGGASDYIMKPLDINELVLGLRKILEERHRFVKLSDLAAQVERGHQELKKLDEMKSEFISLASHELRTPLTALKCATQLMLVGKAGKMSRTQREFLAVSEVNVNRLTKIVNDLLDLLLIQSGKVEMNFEDLDLAELVEFVIACLKARAEEKSIRLEGEILKGIPTIYGDREKVVKILLNLIGNAIKFTPEHGEVSVSARVVEEEDRVSVSVKDSGMGIPQDQLECIFKKFHHVEDASHSAADGPGLGLAITKGLVEALRGEISVESEVGEGSIFTFTLPLSRGDRVHQVDDGFCSNSPLWDPSRLLPSFHA